MVIAVTRHTPKARILASLTLRIDFDLELGDSLAGVLKVLARLKLLNEPLVVTGGPRPGAWF